MNAKNRGFLFGGFIFLFCAPFLAAQNWSVKTAINSSVDFYGVYFTSDQTGYAAGNGGAIYKTSDGGLTWSAQTSGTTNDLKDIFFVSNLVGYATGSGGVILRTANGGNTWTTISTGISGLGSTTFNEISFANTNFGYFVGTGGKMVKTTDGGTTWASITTGTTSDIASTFFTTNQGGYIAYGSIIKKTTDGGTNWTTLSITTSESFKDIFFIDANTGYAACTGGEVWQTIDGGTNWSPKDSGIGSLDNDKIFFSDASNGYVTTSTPYQYFTPDAASNWINFQLSTSGVLDIFFPSTSTGYLVGTQGLLVKYQSPSEPEYQATNLNFTELFSNSMRVNYTASVDIPTGYLVVGKQGSYSTADPLDGTTYTVGQSLGGGTVIYNSSGTSFSVSSLLPSTDYYFKVYAYNGSGSAINYKTTSPLSGNQSTFNEGDPWNSKTNDTYWYPKDVHFFDANSGGIAGGYGLVTTDDGAQSFHSGGANGDGYEGIYFTSATTGYVVGGNGGNVQVIMRTVNGGTTWVDQVRTIGSTLRDVWFTNSITGIAVGSSGTILRTTNGISWPSVTSPTANDLEGIHFPSSSIGYAVGHSGTIINSINGGADWNTQTSPTSDQLNAVFFINDNVGFAVGANGTIINTTNGGTNWNALTSPTSNELFGVHFIDTNTGYVSGSSGTLLKTSDGGATWDTFDEGADLTTDYYGLYFPTASTGYAVGYSGTDTKIYKFQSVPEPTSQPSGISFSSIYQNGLTVTYTAASGSPSGYLVLRGAGSNPTTNPLDGIGYAVDQSLGDATVAYIGSSVSFNETNLSPGTTYYYKIYAYNSSGENTSNNYFITSPLSGNTLTTLLPPTANAATSLSSTGFTANWSSVTGATSYRIDVSLDGFASMVSGYNNATVGSNSLAVTGLQSGTAYSYRVRSVNASGSSSNSSTINVNTIPAAPVLTSTTSISTTGFTVNWNSSVGASGYFIDVSTNSGFSSFVSGYNNLSIATTQASVTGLAAGTVYYYRVRAISSAGTSSNSSTSNTITICAAPSATAASSVSAASFTANWSATTGAADYRIDVSSDPAFSFMVGSYSNQTVNGTSISVTGLTTGTTYYYRIRASNSSGSSANSNVISVLTFPTAPVTNEALSITTTTFSASWNSVATATGYYLDVSLSNSFSSYVSGYNNLSVPGTSTTVTVPSAGTTYYYRIRASNSSGTSANSSSITVLTKPSAPTATSATSITAASFTANWGAVSPTPTEYYIDVSADNFVSNIPGYDNLNVSNASSSISVTGLTAGTTYKYRVRSINATGVSANSNTISVTLIPPAPVSTAATSHSTSGFTSTWQSTVGASSYVLDVSLVNTFSSFVSGYNGLSVSGTSQAVTGLSTGTTYFYRVRAVNAAGTSVSSNIVETITQCSAPVANDPSSISPTSFTATWSTPTGVSDFRLDVATVSNFSSLVSGYNNVTVFGISQPVIGLTPGMTYYYRVRAVNAAGTSINSNTISVLTKPAAPVATNASAISTTGFTANWNTVSGATGYRLDVSSSEFVGFEVNDLSVTGTSSAVTGLSQGVTYKYRVRAVNATGTSDDSNIIATFTIPGDPVANAATSITTTGFTSNWNLVSGATAYFLDVSTDQNFGSFLTGYDNRSVTGNFQIINGLNAGTDYYYRIRAANASGTTGNSNVISAVTIPVAPVANAATAVSASGFTANWNSVTGATQYNLDISSDNAFTNIINQPTSTGVSVAVVGLTAGTNYYYRIRASNASGNSVNSSSINVLTLPAAPVANESTAITSESFKASWSPVNTATEYYIDVSTVNNFSSYVGGYNNLNVGSTSITVTVPTPGISYYYRVRSESAAGSSANSNIISTLVKPAAPTSNNASSISETSFTANWETVTGVSGYYLDVSSNNFSTFLPGYDNFPLTLTSHVVSGLDPGTTYQYRIRSYNATGSSANSAIVSLITIPPKPEATNATNFTTTSFTANWKTTIGADNYRLDVSSDPSFGTGTFVTGYEDKVVNGISDDATGLTPGTIYYFRVRAVNASGTSVNSDAVSSTNIPPPPIGIFTSNITTNSFTANWTEPSGATSYSIDVSTDNFATFEGSFNNLSVVGTSQIVSGLNSATSYQYRIRSNNASGTSPNSGTVILETLPADPAAQPTTLTFNNITTTGMNVSFLASAGGAAGYLVLRKIDASPTAAPVDGLSYTAGSSIGDGLIVYAGSLTSFNETALIAGNHYYYSIYAYNGSGSNTNYLTTQPLEGHQIMVSPAPEISAATAVGQTGFTAHWLSANGASDYVIDVSLNDFITFVSGYNNQPTGNVLSFSVTGLKEGTTYKYRVRAINDAGASISSSDKDVLTIPAAPTGLVSSSILSNSFKISWSKAFGATSYFIDLSADNFATKPVDNLSVVDTSFTFSALAASTDYKVRIRSNNASGFSNNSLELSVKTLALSSGSPLLVSLQGTGVLTLKSSPVTVSAQVTGGTDPKTVMFFYKRFTDDNFISDVASLKSGQTDVYEYVVTKTMTDSLGAEYYFAATDATLTTKESSHNFIYRAVDANSNVFVPFEGNQFDGSPATYQMFSIPYVLADKDISNLFEPSLNGYSNTQWRLLHYANGAYVEYPGQLKKIELGEGYWFNTIVKDFQIKLADAQVKSDITPASPFTMTFQKGWNQIGDPYTFNIDWNVIKDANPAAALNSLWLFEEGGYVKKNVLGVWKGAFVFSDNGGTVTFPLTAKTNESGRKENEFSDPNDSQWLLPVTLSAGKIHTQFAAGMHINASAGKDRFDDISVPRFQDFLEMFTDHPEFFAPHFSLDVVPASSTHTWVYTLSTNSSEENATMEWNSDILKNLSSSIILYDIKNQVLVNMKTRNRYDFHLSDHQQFKLIMMPGEINLETVELNSAYPNPFTDVVNIPVFTEESNSYVRVEVYDIMGRPIKQMETNFVEPGLHTISWDGSSQASTTSAQGVLLYRVLLKDGTTSFKRLVKN